MQLALWSNYEQHVKQQHVSLITNCFIQSNKRTVRLKKIGHIKCQGICSYKRAPNFFSLDNKVTV